MASPTPRSEPDAATLRDAVRDALERAWRSATEHGRLPDAWLDSATVDVERPANPEHGDFATNLALKLARPLRMAPPAIAAVLVEALQEQIADGADSVIASAAAAGPGFVNVTVRADAVEAALDQALGEPAAWGRRPAGSVARHVNVEFVSANPTGPLTVGNARGAFVGDLLARVLEAGGQRVTREYYFNDSGTQVRQLGASIVALRDGREVPEDGYHGDYVADLAAAVPVDLLAAADPEG